MAKIPYFPLYVSDWLGSRKILLMTDAQRGIYITLLAHQWSDPSNSIPTNKKILQKMLPGSKWSNVEYVMRECFEVEGTHEERARNARLNVEHCKAIKKHEQASDAGKLSGIKRKQRTNVERTLNEKRTDVEPYQNQNQNQNQKKLKTFSPDSFEYRTAGLLWDLIRERKPDHKVPDLKAWARDVDLMLRIDIRTPCNIESLIRWCQKDNFWQNNILSIKKLREKFDALELKMNGGTNAGLQISGGGRLSAADRRGQERDESQRITREKLGIGIRGSVIPGKEIINHAEVGRAGTVDQGTVPRIGQEADKDR